MFFKLSRAADPHFSHHHELGDLMLSTDAGWHRTQDTDRVWVYKGYLEQEAWSADVLADLDDHVQLGNFMIFQLDRASGHIQVKTNRWRGVLIWNQPDLWFSNLFRAPYTVWNDSKITIHQDLTFQEHKLDILGHDSTEIQPRDVITAAVDDLLRWRRAALLDRNQLL